MRYRQVAKGGRRRVREKGMESLHLLADDERGKMAGDAKKGLWIMKSHNKKKGG